MNADALEVPPHSESRHVWTLLILVIFVLHGIESLAQKHSFEVKDSIEMARFSDPNELLPGATAKYSPDGKYFVCTTTRGILRSNKVESTVWIFRTMEGRRYLSSNRGSKIPHPIRIADDSVHVSINAIYPYAPVIDDVRWMADSQGVLFLAQTATGTRRLYRASLRERKVYPVSPSLLDVQRYVAQGRTIVYTTAAKLSRANPPDEIAKSDSEAVVATDRSLAKLLFKLKSSDAGDCELWVHRSQENHKLAKYDACWPDTVSTYLDPFSLSPDGRFLAWMYDVQPVPMAWGDLKPNPRFVDVDKSQASAGSPHRFLPKSARQYGLFDLRAGKTAALVDAPYAAAWGYFGTKQATWSPDGKRLLITDVFVPTARRTNEQSDNTAPCLVAVFTIASRGVDCMTSDLPSQDKSASYGPYHLASVSWDPNGRDVDLVIRNTKNSKIIRYTVENGGWHADREEPSETDFVPTVSMRDLPTVSIKQSFEDRSPVLWISDSSHSGALIWDPNPQFSDVLFGKASFYHWTDRTGARWTGGLVLPVGYRAGQRYPLVIQTHGLWDRMFMTDGCFPTAMAARALASAGFVVLQIGIVDADQHTGAPEEAEDAVSGIDAAIDKLAADGLIDPGRVGITGFSRTSWHVETALVKEPKRFAAAILADGIDEGYMQYLLFAGEQNTLRKESEPINDGPPFGQNLNKWLESSAGFHLDQVSTPILIEAHGPQSLLGEWQIYSSLHLQGKPVDLVYFYGEQHILQNPEDRLISQQGAVDWYLFWLQSRENDDPHDKRQYERWELLRDRRDSQIH